MKIDKKAKSYPGVEGEYYDYTGDTGPQKFNVWFKFGCAHVTNVKPEGEPEDINPQEYMHICEPKEFAEFLLSAIAVSEKEGNSWEQ